MLAIGYIVVFPRKLIHLGRDKKGLDYYVYGSVKAVSDIKWIKLTTNMFEDEKMRLIDGMTERDTVHYVWMRLLVQAGKANASGLIFLNENIPYTDEMLATIFCRSVTSIRLALKILVDFEMIEVAPDNIIKIVNWDKHQNIEGMERVRAQNRKRVENHREKKKQTDSNVTHNESNVTVTMQNKKEIENKNKNKNKNENKTEVKSENNKIADDIKNTNLTDQHLKELSDSLSENLKENQIDKPKNNINSKAIELMTYYEKITGVIGGLNYVSLRLAIDMHGEKPVKMAIDKALEVNKTDMPYINGILKNWKRDGYPKEKEVNKNGDRCHRKDSNSDKNEFKGVKPKKPRNLTESERKGMEENLI